MSVKDKVVVITGASSGIGASLAKLLGSQGAKPVLVARREAELAKVAAECGSDAFAVVADVTKKSDLERVVDTTLARHSGIDVWINNAGRGISRFVSELTEEDFDEMMLINVKSALWGMQAVLPHFRQRQSGHIINVSSMLGRVPFASVRSAYSAAKHALNSLTANLRMELLADYPGIHVTTIVPGVVATDFGRNAVGGGMDSRAIPGAQPVEEVASVIAETIAAPKADVYTRPGYREQVVKYYAAEDMAAAEAMMPGAPSPSPSPSPSGPRQPA